MDFDKNRSTCENSNCQFFVNGRCEEGHASLESCPNYSGNTDDDLDIYEDDHDGVHENDIDHSITPLQLQENIPLPSGLVLSMPDVERFLLWRSANMIVIVGDKGSGKSTIICSLYERFLRGPLSNFSFVNSRTLLSFEHRAHYSRVDSGRLTPDTPRTSLSEGLHFFHLALINHLKQNSRIDLLLSDRAGEIYQRVRDHTEMVSTLDEVPRADRLVLLLDGERIRDPLERHGALQSTRQTLRAFLDNGSLGSNSIVQIITTKSDLIESCEDKENIENIIQQFINRLRSDFSNRLRELTFWCVAARDPTGKLSSAHGLDNLLADWVTPKHILPKYSIPTLDLKSEFDKLLARTPLETKP